MAKNKADKNKKNTTFNYITFLIIIKNYFIELM